MAYERLTPPTSGGAIEYERAFRVKAPDRPVIPFIEGDGTGPDIWAAARRVFDAAVAKAFGGAREVEWFEIYAGEKAAAKYGPDAFLPDDTLKLYFAVENPSGVSARALAAILDRTLSGLPPAEVAKVTPEIVERIFRQNISMGKGLGLMSMVGAVQTLAKKAV